MTEPDQREKRRLYVPHKVVSYEAQSEHAHKLALSGLHVWLHRHAYGDPCVTTPKEWCVEMLLTPDGETVSVLPVSNAQAETQEQP